MKFTQVAADAFKKFQLNAGVLLREFDFEVQTYNREDIIGATDGGPSFVATPTYTDFGEDVDNVPAKTMELKVLESVEPVLSGTFRTIDNELGRMLMAAADVEGNKITPRSHLKLTDFSTIWWVGDYSNINEDGGADGQRAGCMAIKLMNALSTGGLSIAPQDKGKAGFAFSFTGHYSIQNIDTIPYELYIQPGTTD